MTPEALILTSDFELCHMMRLAVERFGITAAIALHAADAVRHLDKNKFDLVIVDCSDLEHGCAALRKIRLSRTHRSVVSIAIVLDREQTKYASDSGANFVIAHQNYESEIVATLRSAYGLILRERGRYNRFPLAAPVNVRWAGHHTTEARILNVSQGGACLSSTVPLHGTVQLKFVLEGNDPAIQVSGSVVWQRDRRVGVQFTTMPSASRSQLNEWLARQFEIQTKLQPPLPTAASRGARADAGDSDSPRIFGNSDEIHPIVTAIIRGGPVRARCSACQATITFGNTIGAPLDQERKLREGFMLHLQEKHPANHGSHIGY